MFCFVLCWNKRMGVGWGYFYTAPRAQNAFNPSLVVTSLFNLVISSYPDNMFYHAWTWLLVYDGSTATLFKSVPTCMNKPVNNTVQAGQHNLVQACQCSSLAVNNTVQAGQLNLVQACQQHCSTWPAQPCSSCQCSSLSTGKNKVCDFTCVYWHGRFHETFSCLPCETVSLKVELLFIFTWNLMPKTF